jgi:predicted nucleic acid-binding protein
MPDYLLDTNILIFQLRDNPNIMQLLHRLKERGKVYISATSRTEILAGMRPREEERTMTLLNTSFNLPVDNPIADRAGRLLYQYARQGITLSFPDALIAAIALEHDLILVTTNTKHFPMPELRLHVVEQAAL